VPNLAELDFQFFKLGQDPEVLRLELRLEEEDVGAANHYILGLGHVPVGHGLELGLRLQRPQEAVEGGPVVRADLAGAAENGRDECRKGEQRTRRRHFYSFGVFL